MWIHQGDSLNYKNQNHTVLSVDTGYNTAHNTSISFVSESGEKTIMNFTFDFCSKIDKGEIVHIPKLSKQKAS